MDRTGCCHQDVLRFWFGHCPKSTFVKGILFIDFTDGARLRVNGRASVHDDGAIKELFPDQTRIILVEIEQVVPNCAAHIPKLFPVA